MNQKKTKTWIDTLYVCVVFLGAILIPVIAALRWATEWKDFFTPIGHPNMFHTYKELFADEYESWKKVIDEWIED